MTTSLLAEWDNFYVITGSSAAGLTGLTFVVIALAADANRVNFRGLKAYVTPIIFHFGTVLALAAYLSMPQRARFAATVAALDAVWLSNEAPGILPGSAASARGAGDFVLVRDGSTPLARTDGHGTWLDWVG